MNSSPNNYSLYLRRAKRWFQEEKSYPSVYRQLVRQIDPDTAIAIINELKLGTIQAA